MLPFTPRDRWAPPGVEPGELAPKASMLPLHHSAMCVCVGVRGVEPRLWWSQHQVLTVTLHSHEIARSGRLLVDRSRRRVFLWGATRGRVATWGSIPGHVNSHSWPRLLVGASLPPTGPTRVGIPVSLLSAGIVLSLLYRYEVLTHCTKCTFLMHVPLRPRAARRVCG